MISVPKNIIQTLDELRALKGQTIYAAINIWGSLQFVFEEIVVGDLCNLTECLDQEWVNYLIANGEHEWAILDRTRETKSAYCIVNLCHFAPFVFDKNPSNTELTQHRCVLLRDKSHVNEWRAMLALTIEIEDNYDLSCNETMENLKSVYNLSAISFVSRERMKL